LAVVGLLALLALTAFLFPQQVLCLDSGPVKADAMVVLGGGWQDRAQQAAKLFKARAAPRILLTGKGDCDLNREDLIRAGVPAAVITLEAKSTTTKENAKFTTPLLRKLAAERGARGAEGPLRVIIVTTWYHSRRALHAFQHYAPDIQFYSCPSYFGYPSGQRSRESISRHIRAEYFKLVGYWLCYGICPF
jgi:uncharacterized SAM-binding protein YcdF (DUF218 family)